MIRRLAVASVAILVMTSAMASAEDRPRAPVKRTVSLTFAGEAMAAVPTRYTIAAAPTPGVQRLRAAIQVRAQRGWVTLRSAAPDRRGRASGEIVSNRAVAKQYRAVLISTKGRVVTASTPTNLTWSRLEHSVRLECSVEVSAIDTDVPCRIVVSPPVRIDDMITVLEANTGSAWVLVEAARVEASGLGRTHVNGFAVGTVDYRVVLMRNGEVRAESPVLTVTYTSGD